MNVLNTYHWIETLDAAELASIRDALQRVLSGVPGCTPLRADVCAARATDHPQVQRLHIIVYFEPGTIMCPRCELIWVDDYELAFLLIDDL